MAADGAACHAQPRSQLQIAPKMPPTRMYIPYGTFQAVSYIRATWPHWDAAPGGPGSRHIFVHTGDWGRDDTTPEVQALTANATWLTHWGEPRVLGIVCGGCRG